MVEPIVTLGVTILFATLFTVLFVMTILIQVNTLNTIKFIKKQFRELLTKELLKHLEEASKLEKELDQLNRSNN